MFVNKYCKRKQIKSNKIAWINYIKKYMGAGHQSQSLDDSIYIYII